MCEASRGFLGGFGPSSLLGPKGQDHDENYPEVHASHKTHIEHIFLLDYRGGPDFLSGNPVRFTTPPGVREATGFNKLNPT